MIIRVKFIPLGQLTSDSGWAIYAITDTRTSLGMILRKIHSGKNIYRNKSLLVIICAAYEQNINNILLLFALLAFEAFVYGAAHMFVTIFIDFAF